MKKQKAIYTSIFFLCCFITSFGVNTFYNLNTSVSKINNFKFSKAISISSKDETKASNLEVLFEETEDETENDFALQAFLLPFFLAYFQFAVTHTKPVTCSYYKVSQTNPIYLEVRNFRI